MNSLRTLLVAGLVLAASPRGLAQLENEDLARLLPANTFLYLSVQNLGSILDIDPDGAVSRLLHHAAMKQAFEEVYESFDWLEDRDLMLSLNLDTKQLAQLFHGRIAIALPEVILKETALDETGSAVSLSLDPGRGAVLLADFDGTEDQLNELLENLLKVWEEEEEDVSKVTLIPEDFEGMPLMQIEVIDANGEVDEEERYLAFRDGLLTFSDNRTSIEDVLDRLKNGAPEDDRLIDQPRYVETLDSVGDHDALIYLNLGEVGPLINQVIHNQIEQAGTRVTMYVTAENLIAALGLDAFWSTYIGLRVDDDEAELTFGITHEDREQGLATLIAYRDGGVEIPTFFNPAFHSASVSCYDLSAVWKNIESMVKKASPFGHTWMMTQLARVEGMGFPLRDALLENLDGLLIDVLGYPEESTAGPDDHPSQAYILRIRDPQTLAEALEEFGESASDDEPTEFMNARIYTVSLPFDFGAGANLAYAVVENYLIAAIGDPKMVESIIAHIKNPGESLMDDKVLMDGFDALPGEHVVSIGFADVSDLIIDSLRGGDDMLEMQMGQTRDRAQRERLGQVKQGIEELPDVSDIDYFLVSKTYRTRESFVQRLLMRQGR